MPKFLSKESIFMKMQIVYIWPFVFLILIPWIVIVWRNSLVGLSRWRNWITLFLRIALLIVLILTLANLQLVYKSKKLTVSFVLDGSASIPVSMQDQAKDFITKNMALMNSEHDQADLWIFGQDIKAEFRNQSDLSSFHKIETVLDNKNQTHISQALKIALATLPQEGERRIVLLSDGNETMGNCRTEIVRAKEQDVPIDVFPLAVFKEQDVIVEKLTAPDEVNEGQSYDVNCLLVTNEPTTTLISYTVNGILVQEGQVQLKAGKNNITLTVPSNLVKKGYQRIIVSTNTPNDLVSHNNSAQIYSYAYGKPNILFVEGISGDHKILCQALSEDENSLFRIKIISPEEFPCDPVDLNEFDAIILSNVPANELPKKGNEPIAMNLIENVVKHDGIGLIMIGGENSFGAGGYRGTMIERALPVDMEIKNKKSIPNGALAVILHTCEFPDGNNWAKKITKTAITELFDDDLAGVLLFDGGRDRWLFSLRPIKNNRSSMFSLIDQAEPSDMPNFSPTLEASHQALKIANAGKKHIVVISDGDPTPPSSGLLSKIITSQISISTILIYPHSDQDDDRMKYMANRTGGRFYHVKNPEELPAIFAKEALTIKRNLIVESPEGFPPVLNYHTELIKGISIFPAIHGYIATTPKPLAKMPLYIQHEEDTDPLLAHIQYGLGRTVAFTSDAKNRWGHQWASWKDFAKFWKQTLLWTIRKSQPNEFQIQTTFKEDQGKVIITAVDQQGEFVNFLQMQGVVRVFDQDSQQTTYTIPITQTGPGHYEGTFPTHKRGIYLINANYQIGPDVKQLRHGFYLSHSAEYIHTKANVALLEDIAKQSGGRYLKYNSLDKNLNDKIEKQEWLDSPTEFSKYDLNSNGIIEKKEYPQDESIFIHTQSKYGSPIPLWPMLLKIFLLVFLFDIFLRRVIFDSREILQKIIKLYTPDKNKKSEEVSTTINRLEQKKQNLQKKWQENSQKLQALEKIGETQEKLQKKAIEEKAKGQEVQKEKESLQATATFQKMKPISQSVPKQSQESDSSNDYIGRLLKAKQKTWESKKKEEK